MTETQPADLLMGFALSLIAPLLMIGGVTDIDLARKAATETIAAYKATGQDQIVSIAQIVGFALVSLDNLRLSVPSDVSLTMKLKLRGNANAMNRASQRATATLEGQRREAPVQEADPVAVIAALEEAKTEVAQAGVGDGSADRGVDLAWAGAMTEVAAEYAAELAGLAPAQRRTHLARIGALSDIARALGRGEAPALKVRLLGGTTLGG
jgi:hypothetical protein